MKKRILFIIIFIFLFSGCDTTDPKPPEEKPPGYQEDIPWPSLADSPWPMNHGNPQSTGRSKYVGPTEGVLVNKISANQMHSSLVLGTDSDIWFATASPGYIYKTDYNGEILWDSLIVYAINTTPLVSSDGIIYVGTNNAELLALNSDGSVKWIFKADKNIASLGMNIGLDGTLYFIDATATLFAVNKNGSLKWKYTNENFYWGAPCAPTFAPDGKTLYIQGWKGVSLISFDVVLKKISWTIEGVILESSPVIDSEGNLYYILDNEESAKMYSLNKFGELRWSFSFHESGIIPNTEPTIDIFGNIYFGADTLYSVTNNGELRWKYGLDGHGIMSPIICDVEGTIYIGTSKELGISKKPPILEKKWEVIVNDERVTGASPAIAEDGTLYFPTFRSNSILVIK